jgi:tetratricopeptide (TPR) repeat protein
MTCDLVRRRRHATCVLSLAWILGMWSVDPVSGRTADASPASTAPALSAESGLSSQAQTAALKTEELELAKTLLKAFPDNENVQVLMGNILERHGDTASAMNFWKTAIQLNPRRADLYCHLGKVTLGKGAYGEAIESYQKAATLDGSIPGGVTGWALALMGAGRHSEAMEVLQKGLAVLPDQALGHDLIGQIYLQRKAYGKAREHYEMAIRVEPDYTPAHYGLMSVYSRLKQPAKAQEYRAIFKRLKAQETKVLKDRNEAANDLRFTRTSVANTYASAETFYQAPSTLKRAHELLTRGLAIDPNSLACLESLGTLYFASGRLPNALSAFKRASEVAPDRLIFLMNVGVISSRLGRLDEAEEAFQKAVALAPTSSDALRELARVYLQTGKKLPQALELAKKASALESKAENYFVMAWASNMNGEAVLSLAALEKAIQLAPNNVRYRQAYEQAKKSQ